MSGAVYRQNPETVARKVDETVFLVSPDESICHLDTIGAALWHLLAEPHAIDAATDIVCHAFPDLPPERIAGDVADLITDLAKRRFVIVD